MSAIRTRRNSSKPQIIKLDNCDEISTKNSGKPCIDFQPDDRWQLKEENDSTSENNCATKNSDADVTSPKIKSPTVINGESANHVSDSENSENCSSLKSEVVDVKTDNSEECNKENSESDSEKQNCRVRKKRKNSSPDKTNGKKMKSSNEDNETDASIKSCSSGDEIDAESSKRDTNETDTESKSSKKDTNETDTESKSSKRDTVDTESKSSKRDTNKTDTESKSSNSISKEEAIQAISNIINKTNLPKASSEDDISEVLSNNIEIKKTEILDTIEIKDNSIIEIFDDDSPEDKKDDADSDNEIQIIEGSVSPKKPKKDVQPLENQMSLTPVGDTKLTKDEILLSAGYPYYNSIAEKVKNFTAGKYNPVKFPHMGTLYLSDTEVIIESPSLLVPLLIKEADEFPKLEEESDQESKKPIFRKNFFQSSVGQFLINLGASRVYEWYHRDMKRIASKQARKANLTNKQIEEAIQLHDVKCNEAKEANLAFNHRLRRCQHCDFRTESLIVMEAHYLIPHVSPRREFKCNFCTYLTRDLKEITFHFEAIHGKKATMENQILLHECLFCTFQSHLKSKVTVHMTRCKKNFIQTQNQSPPYDFEFPGVTTKPVSLADISGHRRMLLGSVKAQPGSFESFVQSAFAKKKLPNVMNMPGMENFPENSTLVKHLMGQQGKQANSGYQLPPGIVLTRPRVRTQQQMRQLNPGLQPRNLPSIRSTTSVMYPSNIPSGISITPVQTNATKQQGTTVKNLTLTPISSTGNQVVAKGGPPQPVALFTNVAGNDARARMSGIAPGKVSTMAMGRGTRMVPPYQRLNTPPSQIVKNSSGSTFVMCEICDSYIKDLEELRSHMNWVHKVKIHPKMLVSRPPLNCQKCQWRFFTDQGLERHLLGAHGLVTTNMQEMANNNQDGGRCIICGAVFTYKLVSHMTQVHKVTLKPAHLSYKCTVCTATFTLYRLFESHVYNVHSGSAKRNAEEPASSEPPAKKTTIEVKEIKEEVKEVVKEPLSRKCKDCGFITEFLEDHIQKKHMKECAIKICRIDKCKTCLYSSDEMIVMRTSDIDSEEESDSETSEDDSDDVVSLPNEPGDKNDSCITIDD